MTLIVCRKLYGLILKMRRGQITLTGLPIQELADDPVSCLKKAGFGIPDYAINCIACVRLEKGTLRVMFFEDPDDTLTQYTRFLLFRRKPDVIISYYTRGKNSDPWVKTPAPTLVSTHIETKLR